MLAAAAARGIADGHGVLRLFLSPLDAGESGHAAISALGMFRLSWRAGAGGRSREVGLRPRPRRPGRAAYRFHLGQVTAPFGPPVFRVPLEAAQHQSRTALRKTPAQRAHADALAGYLRPRNLCNGNEMNITAAYSRGFDLGASRSPGAILPRLDRKGY